METVYNFPTELDAAYYSEPRCPIRDLPPIPVANGTDGPCGSRPTTMEMISGVISNNPRTGDGISSDFSPSSKVKTSYSRLESSTREPPRAPIVYDHLVKPVYVNMNIAFANDEMSDITCDGEDTDSAISSSVSPSSEVGGSYSGLESSTREPPRAPVVYDPLVKPVYVNTNKDLSIDETSGILSDERETASGISVSPSSEAGASYSTLESSTREPPRPPVVYDSLMKPVYVNINTVSYTHLTLPTKRIV